MRGKPNVSSFVAEFLKRKDAEAALRSAAGKGKGKGAAPAAAAKPVASKPVGNDWQKAAAAPAAGKKGGGGKQPAVKKVAGITATVPGFSLLSDRA